MPRPAFVQSPQPVVAADPKSVRAVFVNRGNRLLRMRRVRGQGGKSRSPDLIDTRHFARHPNAPFLIAMN